MKLKKLLAATLATVMVAALAACGGEGAAAGNDQSGVSGSVKENTEQATGGAAVSGGKLVVWTLAADLQQFAERYHEKTGVDVETVIIEPGDYPTRKRTRHHRR